MFMLGLLLLSSATSSCIFDRYREAADPDAIDPTSDFGPEGENQEMSDWMKMARENQDGQYENQDAPTVDLGNGLTGRELGGASFTFDPSAALPAPGEIAAGADTGSAWDISGTRAIRTAKGERRLLFTWFTASATSPRCKHLDAEVFQSEQFASMAEKDLVLLYIDYSNRDTRDSDYYARWKVRHKIRGYPTVVLFSPAGKEIGRIKGYTKGDRAWFIYKLKSLIATGKKQIASENKALAKKGYRHWKNTMGTSFYARFESRDGDDIILRDLIGKNYRTGISELSPDDLIWLSKNGKMNTTPSPGQPGSKAGAAPGKVPPPRSR